MNVNQYEEDLPLITEAIQHLLEILKDFDENEQIEYREVQRSNDSSSK